MEEYSNVGEILIKNNQLIIGIGGGAGNAVAKFNHKNILLINSHLCALDILKEKYSNIQTLQIGRHACFGYGGCGGKPTIGFQSFIESKNDISAIINGYDSYVLVACIGGGCGTGVILQLAQSLHNAYKNNLCIFVKPLAIEQKRIGIAEEFFQKVITSNIGNSIIIDPEDEKLRFESTSREKLSLIKAFELSNKIIRKKIIEYVF